MSLSLKNKWNSQMLWIWISLLFAVDILTKYYIFSTATSLSWVTPTVNSWGAWSISLSVVVVTIISVLIISLLTLLYQKKYLTYRSFIFLMGWALGNLYDRIIIGGVRDWISLSSFPVFNIADIFITVWVIILIVRYRQASRIQRH